MYPEGKKLVWKYQAHVEHGDEFFKHKAHFDVQLFP